MVFYPDPLAIDDKVPHTMLKVHSYLRSLFKKQTDKQTSVVAILNFGEACHPQTVISRSGRLTI